ncbi:sulfurtransferase TusA family protein [Glycomyces sp. L485]|uniref:sulfurtransferase TusA family protein n=1 Tax=Glycomyces sp. L485 TaxID=2909235 RepID=UPI001F4B7389|nr:sulfurtransferase TusA family protein [Glycomyces sp. L485]MCH7230924.1 sulfurtransferase TusA family protein [Glycomyces sp. L485]
MTPAAVCDGGALDCGGGLLIAIRRALNGIGVGEILEIRSRAPSVEIDLPAWCDLAGHPLEQTARDGSTTSYFVRKGR